MIGLRPPLRSSRSSEFWDAYWSGFEKDKTKRVTYELSARHTLALLKKEGQGLRILDLGCGAADISIVLARRSNARIVAVDYSEAALSQAEENIASAKLSDRIELRREDAFGLSFSDRSFDGVVSYGHASVASYQGVQSEVARVVRPGGFVVADFRHLSLYNTILSPLTFVRQVQRYLGGDPKIYHLGQIGLRRYFDQHNLVLEKSIAFNTYPPLMGNRLPESFYLGFERSVGRLLRSLLARVQLSKFRRI